MTSGTTGTHGTHGHHGHHGHHEDIVHGGEHFTETANKLDPHVSGGTGGVGVESVTSGAAHGRTGISTGTGAESGYGSSSTGTGSGLTGSSGRDYYSSNTGTLGSNTTTGPHSSSMMNKLDPRVDSDRDGSKTTGGSSNYGSNQTYK